MTPGEIGVGPYRNLLDRILICELGDDSLLILKISRKCFTLAMCAVQCGNSGCLANVESLGGWVGESLLVSGRSMLIAQSCICNSGAAMQWGNGQ